MKLRIEKAIYGGSGLAHIDDGELAGKTAFVPLTLPGELVEAHGVEDKRSFINAEVDSVLEASPYRITPGCNYFGTCGGCSYQHADYARQVEIKAAILREALERAHLQQFPTYCGSESSPLELSQSHSPSSSAVSVCALLPGAPLEQAPRGRQMPDSRSHAGKSNRHGYRIWSTASTR